MKQSTLMVRISTVAVAATLAGCATWHNMDKQEKGAAVGASGGALVGAAVAGPVGAVVGAGAGAYAGHYETKPGGIASNTPPGSNAVMSSSSSAARNTTATNPASMNGGNSTMQNPDQVRSVQRALNDRGFDAGAPDGVWGPNTEQALRNFQQRQGLPVTGNLDDRTAAALGVSR